jgi:hypothetical protein
MLIKLLYPSPRRSPDHALGTYVESLPRLYLDGISRMLHPNFRESTFQLDFSHCAAYQSASIKCFIRAMGLLRVLVGGQPAKSPCVSLRLPPAHEEWVKCQKGIRPEEVS